MTSWKNSNYFLECILKTLDEPTEGRLIAHLLSMPLNDGGQWDMLTAIVSKYGLVPKGRNAGDLFPPSATNEMVSYMTEKLREYACILRKAHKDGKTDAELRAMKDEMMQTVYNMLCNLTFGKPPKTFDFEVP